MDPTVYFNLNIFTTEKKTTIESGTIVPIGRQNLAPIGESPIEAAYRVPIGPPPIGGTLTAFRPPIGGTPIGP